MAEKDKVPLAVIRFIVGLRSDEHKKYSYKAISELVKDQYNIEVTQQAIGYLYRRYKDILNSAEIEPIHSSSDAPKEIKTAKPVFKPKNPNQNESLDHVFSKDENIDLQDFFEKAE